MTATWRRTTARASISRRRMSISSLPPSLSVERCNAPAGGWSIAGPPTTGAPSQCINAKAETLEQRATFREAFQQRRCVVPADGFYEWTGPKGKRQPLWLVTAGRAVLRELTTLSPFRDALPNRLEKALGLTFRADIDGASVFVCPAKHFSYPMRAEMQSQIGQQIAAALDRSTG